MVVQSFLSRVRDSECGISYSSVAPHGTELADKLRSRSHCCSGRSAINATEDDLFMRVVCRIMILQYSAAVKAGFFSSGFRVCSTDTTVGRQLPVRSRPSLCIVVVVAADRQLVGQWDDTFSWRLAASGLRVCEFVPGPWHVARPSRSGVFPPVRPEL